MRYVGWTVLFATEIGAQGTRLWRLSSPQLIVDRSSVTASPNFLDVSAQCSAFVTASAPRVREVLKRTEENECHPKDIVDLARCTASAKAEVQTEGCATSREGIRRPHPKNHCNCFRLFCSVMYRRYASNVAIHYISFNLQTEKLMPRALEFQKSLLVRRVQRVKPRAIAEFSKHVLEES